MKFDDVTKRLQNNLIQVEEALRKNYYSDVPIIPGIGDYILNAGGKRIRPQLLLLSSKLCGHEPDDTVITHCCVVEYIHSATLLHDDVVDETTVRRGRETVNSKWGSDASILVGDFLIAKAIMLLSANLNSDIFRAIAEASKTLVEGGLLEITHARDINVTENHCMDVIRRKTASIMALSCQLGAQLAGVSTAKQKALKDFGEHFGIAFQLMDDLLDYAGSKEQLGKPPGTDFKEGHVTLPLHNLYHHSGSDLRAEIKGFIQNENLGQKELDYILERMRDNKALDHTLRLAKAHVQLGKEALMAEDFASPDHLEDFFAVADHIVERYKAPKNFLTPSRT